MKSISKKIGQKSKMLFVSLLAMVFLMLTACDKKGEPAKSDAQSTEQPVAGSEAKPADPPANFKHQTALVNGVNIHYVIGGQGEPLHGPDRRDSPARGRLGVRMQSERRLAGRSVRRRRVAGEPRRR